MAKIVPLISSGVAGPLGALHLPRLWLKVSLESLGKLADGYPGIGKGYDMMTINALGLNADAVKKLARFHWRCDNSLITRSLGVSSAITLTERGLEFGASMR